MTLKSIVVIFIFFMLSVSCLGAEYTENFDTYGNWSGGSFLGNYTYTNDDSEPLGDQFSCYSGMRETTYTHSAPYAFEIDGMTSRYLRYEATDISVSSFSVWCARHLSNYDVDVEIEYSTDSGDTWNIIDSFNTNYFTANRVYKQYSYTFDTPITNEPGESLCIQFRNASYYITFYYDDFTVNYSLVIYPEPESHVTDFTATTDGFGAIDLSWTDTDDASGYLVMLNTENSFTDPEDETIIEDGLNAKNFIQGVESYKWKGLKPGTQYFFKIWPYSNGGSYVDYKTGGAVPEVSATTDILPASMHLIISEVADPAGVFNAGFVELYNASDTDINFNTDTWYLSQQTYGTMWSNRELTGIVPAHGVYVSGSNNDNESDAFYINYGYMADYNSSFTNLGDNGIYLFYGGNNSTGVLVDSYGIIDEDGTGKAWEYTNSQAERAPSINTPNPRWEASEWSIAYATPGDMSPGSHLEGGVIHQNVNLGGGDSMVFPSQGEEDVTVELDENESGYVQVSVEINNEMYPGAHTAYLGWWDINISGNSEPIDFVFTYDESALNEISEADLAVFHHNGEGWDNLGGVVNEISNTITLVNYSGTFSPFTLGNNEDTMLPVTLSSFTAIYSASHAVLQWTTQSEMSNSGWNVYRAESNDFSLSVTINSQLVSGNGTTSEISHYSFTDNFDLIQGNCYYYWLESISYSGDVEHYGPVALAVPVEEDQEVPDVPEKFNLFPNYPNPFNPSTTIKYNLPLTVDAQIIIYNVRGEEVKILQDGIVEAGYHQIKWDGSDNSGKESSSGIYFYKLITPHFVKSRSMLLIK